MDTDLRFLPEAASTGADQADRLYIFLVCVATFFTILIFVMIVAFVYRYRKGSKADRTLDPHQSHWLLEATWTLIPLGLTMIMFAWGADLFFRLHDPPHEGLEVNVVAKQWMWRIQHPGGKREINALHVPVGSPVKLRMISEDVIHSFFVPAFRIKQDVLPGRYTSLWFEATKPGAYHLFCAEYCGTNHSRMVGTIIVQEPADYAQWLQGGAIESPEAAGKKLFDQFRCVTCHANPVVQRCPPLDGLFGRKIQLSDGSTITADEAYIRQSILEPAAKVVAGYQPIMPTFQGQIGEEGVFQLIAYLKSLSPPAETAPPASGEEQP